MAATCPVARAPPSPTTPCAPTAVRVGGGDREPGPAAARSAPRVPQWRGSSRTTSSSASTPSCATSPSSGTSATCSKPSGPSCASTSSPQRRGAAVHPRPAPLDLRVGQAPEQLLRLRHGQRPGRRAELRHHQARGLPPARARPTTGDARAYRAALRQGPRRGQRRAKAFRPDSVVNISAMSFGALGAHAVEAINRGAALAGCLHNTGEGGISPYHQHGGDLVFRSAPATSGAATPTGGSACRRCRSSCAAPPCGRSRSSSARAPSPASAGCCPAPR